MSTGVVHMGLSEQEFWQGGGGGHAEEEAMLGRRLHAACTMKALNEHGGKGAARPGTQAGACRKTGKDQEAGADEGKGRAKAKGGGRGSGEHQSMGDPRPRKRFSSLPCKHCFRDGEQVLSRGNKTMLTAIQELWIPAPFLLQKAFLDYPH